MSSENAADFAGDYYLCNCQLVVEVAAGTGQTPFLSLLSPNQQSVCCSCTVIITHVLTLVKTRSSAITEGPRNASCQLKSCQLPRNSADTTYTTSPDQIDGMKLEI